MSSFTSADTLTVDGAPTPATARRVALTACASVAATEPPDERHEAATTVLDALGLLPGLRERARWAELRVAGR